MMKNRKLFLSIFLLVMLSVVVSARNPEILYPGDSSDGSFISITAGVSPDSALSLLDPDTKSSSWYFRIDGDSVDPVEDGWNTTKRSSDYSATYVLSSRLYEFSREITILGEGSHCRINAVFTNHSSESVTVEPFLLLDTWLGEDNGLPFLLNDGSYPQSEISFEGNDIPSWIKTVRNSSSPELTIVLNGRLPTKPESVTLANWLRIREGLEGFVPVEGRSFDYLPFSENDSAVLIGYKEKHLSAGETMSFTVVLGLDEGIPDPEEYEAIERTAVDAEIENRRLREYTLRERLREIYAIMDEIDTILDTNSDPGTDKLAELESMTAGQETLKTEYENL